MVAVTHDMLNDPGKIRILEREELTKSLLKQMRDIHNKMAIHTKEDGLLQARLLEIIEEQRQCDQVHDRLARGIYRSLESAADLSPTAEKGRVFTDINNLLFPAGLSINLLSYREESGNVLKVAQQITPQIRAVLESIIIQGRTLADSFDEWVQNGEQLGKLVAERASLSGDEDATKVSAGDLRDLRNRWARVMNLLVSTLDLLEAPEPDRRRLLSNLRDAEAAAIRTRAAEQRRNAQSTPEEQDLATDDLQPLAANIEEPT